MKCISLWQPWASLWAVGRKSNETRGWETSYRGPLLIHAAKKLVLPENLNPVMQDALNDEFGGHWPLDLERGAIIGYCVLTDCKPTERLIVSDEERAMGDYSDGRFAWWSMENRLLKKPIPYRGLQRIFNVPEELIPNELVTL